MKLSELYDKMWAFNQKVAFGAECDAWVDFVDECYTIYGFPPWHDLASLQVVSTDFVDYWNRVSQADVDGMTADYDDKGIRTP